MLNLKGFVSIPSMANNGAGSANPLAAGFSSASALGELSALSKTYSTSQRDYGHPTLKDYMITSFFEDDHNPSTPVESAAMSMAIEIVDYIKQYGAATAGAITDVAFVGAINSSYINKITNFTYGPWITVGATILPEWVSYDDLVNLSNGVLAHIKLWLSDAAFISQYDSYEIRVAGGIDSNLNFIFQNNIGGVRAQAALATPELMIAKLDNVKAGYPESKTALYRFDYQPTNPAIPPIPFWWAVANYSLYGDTIDAVKLTITTQLLSSSVYGQQDWETYFPSLFKTTEFYIVPRWDRYAIPNLSVQTGMYSSITNPSDAVRYIQAHLPPTIYTPLHVVNNLSVFGALYKELAIYAIGDPNNLNGKTSIEMVYPDYLSVPTTSGDFGRMSVATQGWVLLIERMLIAAETVTLVNSVPTGLRKVVRGTNLFVSATYNNVQYLVPAKSNGWV